MSKFQVTVLKDAKIAVVRTIKRHGQPMINPSIFAGAQRTTIPLHNAA